MAKKLRKARAHVMSVRRMVLTGGALAATGATFAAIALEWPVSAVGATFVIWLIFAVAIYRDNRQAMRAR